MDRIQAMTHSGYRSRLRFNGMFRDRERERWHVHLLYTPSPDEQAKGTQAMRFGSQPLVINREGERMTGLVLSRATLRVLSEEDGQYRHLYSKPEGSVMMVVWRGETLYWLGALDPEDYEEDYTRQDKYIVDLRFSDFGRAKRLRHKFKGNKNLREWLTLAIKNSLSRAEGHNADTQALPHTALPIDFGATWLIDNNSDLMAIFADYGFDDGDIGWGSDEF